MSITLMSSWKQVNIGQAVEIDSVGEFVTTSAKPDPDAMMIASNNYRTGHATGIRIVIGIQNAADGFVPIFIDPYAIAFKMQARYRPLEVLQWWYAVGAKAFTMSIEPETPLGTGDFSMSMYKKSSYCVENGVWTTEDSAN